MELFSMEPFKALDYISANDLHIHFYQGHLDDKNLKNVRRITKRLIKGLNAYLAQPATGGPGT